MEDYPRTLEEFEGRFATEQACREYLMQLRWPQGFVCPRCGGRRARPSWRGLLRCGQCDYQASVTAGTIFQDTRLPLRTWFRTMWWVTSQKNGASALGLQSILGLGSYRTAWALLHKLRRAMVRPGRERLSGRVEVDETYVGDAEEGLRGRQTQKKALVAIAAEEDGAGIGRIRMKRIREASKQQLHGFIQEAVEPDSTIHTDGWEGYVGLEALGYRHEYDFLAGSSQSASELLPHVHRVAALLKRWLIGTHQGAVSREHLDYYLDEYTFRFNRRRSRHRGKLFYRACTTGRDRWAHDLFRDGLTPTRQADRPTTRCGVVGSEVHTPIPPLREHKCDIPLLCNHLLRVMGAKQCDTCLSPEILDLLVSYDYPGNVRELENIIQRALILSCGESITLDHLAPEVLAASQNGAGLPEAGDFHSAKARAVEAFERDYLTGALRRCGGIVTRAAHASGLSERNFHEKLKRYDICAKGFRDPAASESELIGPSSSYDSHGASED